MRQQWKQAGGDPGPTYRDQTSSREVIDAFHLESAFNHALSTWVWPSWFIWSAGGAKKDKQPFSVSASDPLYITNAQVWCGTNVYVWSDIRFGKTVWGLNRLLYFERVIVRLHLLKSVWKLSKGLVGLLELPSLLQRNYLRLQYPIELWATHPTIRLMQTGMKRKTALQVQWGVGEAQPVQGTLCDWAPCVYRLLFLRSFVRLQLYPRTKRGYTVEKDCELNSLSKSL